MCIFLCGLSLFIHCFMYHSIRDRKKCLEMQQKMRCDFFIKKDRFEIIFNVIRDLEYYEMKKYTLLLTIMYVRGKLNSHSGSINNYAV